MRETALPDDLSSDRDPGGEHPCRYGVHGYHLLVLSHGLRERSASSPDGPRVFLPALPALPALPTVSAPPTLSALLKRPSERVAGVAPEGVQSVFGVPSRDSGRLCGRNARTSPDRAETCMSTTYLRTW
ncbi:hypothetical protein GCM10027075_53180 [Streptomyces heilongjiangensis]